MKIILSILTALFIIGCSEEATAPVEVVAEKTVMQKASEAVVEVKEEVQTKTSEIVANVTEKAVALTTGLDGKALYAKCAGCHGSQGERSALGKSKMINTWSVKQIEDALNGYKDGSFGGPMKGMMQSQVANLNTKEITAIAEYIAK